MSQMYRLFFVAAASSFPLDVIAVAAIGESNFRTTLLAGVISG
jgi:hypothetical protein